MRQSFVDFLIFMSFLLYPLKFVLILFLFLVVYIVGFFPWKIQSKFAYLGAWAIKRTSRWQVILRNYELCFPEWDEKTRLQYAIKQCYYIATMPLIMFNSLHRKRIITSQVKRIEGLEYLQNLQKQNKGCLLLGNHSTSMDVANRYLSQYFDIAAVYQKGEEGLSNYLMEQIRKRLNTPLIEKSQSIKMIRHLREGGILWYAADQNYGGKMKEKLSFFGNKVNTIVGWDRMFKGSDVELLLLNSYYEKDGYVVELHPPFANYKEMSSAQLSQQYLHFFRTKY